MKIIRELGMGCFFSFSFSFSVLPDGSGLGVVVPGVVPDVVPDGDLGVDRDLLEKDCDLLEGTGFFSGKFNVPFLFANCIFFC
jgi:hypothetical protein